MSRPVFIFLAAGFVLLLVVGVLRLGGSSESDDVRVVPIAHGPHADGERSRARGQDVDASAQGASRARSAPSSGVPGRNPVEPRMRDERPDERGKGGLTTTSRDHNRVGATALYGDASRHESGGNRAALAGANPLGAAGRSGASAAGDDTRFHAAAEQLAEAGRPAPPADHGEEPKSEEDLVHEPPAKPVVDDSMTYNSGDYRFSLDSPFQIPHTGDAGTVALWMQPEWSPDDQQDAAVMQLGDGKFQVYKNVNVLRFEVATDSPEHSTSYSLAGWQAGEWHAITASWGDGQVTFYVDGQAVGKPIQATFKQDGETPVTIGTIAAADQPVAPATVSDVSLRNRGLSADEIAKLYNRSPLAPRSQ